MSWQIPGVTLHVRYAEPPTSTKENSGQWERDVVCKRERTFYHHIDRI